MPIFTERNENRLIGAFVVLAMAVAGWLNNQRIKNSENVMQTTMSNNTSAAVSKLTGEPVVEVIADMKVARHEVSKAKEEARVEALAAGAGP